jgi:hypothetical protein
MDERVAAFRRRQGTRPAVYNITNAIVQSNVTKEEMSVTLLKSTKGVMWQRPCKQLALPHYP